MGNVRVWNLSLWKVWIARRVSLGTISTIKRSNGSHDWWLFNNKVHGGLECIQVDRSQFPGSCYTHELGGFRHSDREWRKSPQLLKDKSKQQNVLQFCRDTPWSWIEFTLKKKKKRHLFQIPLWPKGENLRLISLLSWFLKLVWLLYFLSRKDQKLHVSSPCQEPHGCSWDTKVCIPQTLLFYGRVGGRSSLIWGKTHFLPMFISATEKKEFALLPLASDFASSLDPLCSPPSTWANSPSTCHFLAPPLFTLPSPGTHLGKVHEGK